MDKPETPLIIGISTFAFEVIGEIPAFNENFSVLDFLLSMSKTDDNLPPNCEGILLLYISKFSNTSELNAEKNPKK